jgi:ketosteroid isomerase-like protein
MKHASRIVGLLSLICVAVFVAAPLPAQQWSDAQKDVWKSVENYCALDAKGDLEGFMSYFDAGYVGWSYDSPVPGDKATAEKFMAQEYQMSKTLVYDIKPLAIQVHGNFAFVHYYFLTLAKNADGKIEEVKGRWTDILAKQGDRWVLIGDHGGRMKKD